MGSFQLMLGKLKSPLTTTVESTSDSCCKHSIRTLISRNAMGSLSETGGLYTVTIRNGASRLRTSMATKSNASELIETGTIRLLMDSSRVKIQTPPPFKLCRSDRYTEYGRSKTRLQFKKSLVSHVSVTHTMSGNSLVSKKCRSVSLFFKLLLLKSLHFTKLREFLTSVTD
jgi:hypothetical protein